MKYFTISEFTDEKIITPRIADLILTKHIEVMVPIREKLGIPVYVSEKSGYRSYDTEINAKRSGDSEHVFKGLGAADYTCARLKELGMLLLKHSPYTRICYYPEDKFYHCDYKSDIIKTYVCVDNEWVNAKWW